MSKNTGNNGPLDGQTRGHQEGQMNNIAPGSRNNAQGMSDIQPDQKQVRSEEGASASETESDRANRNEDEGVRGGNSSI